ncbi:MAG TPA: glycosyltransferase family 2 protein [Candidatus Paceibacterota bacterium]|nr:glycosyltransferase family 2 protein [Verrucomicrobiota bacterium]HRY48610.1 glycosyltransferase family 2 protein [Candidatus Paceibacterota bacterium]
MSLEEHPNSTAPGESGRGLCQRMPVSDRTEGHAVKSGAESPGNLPQEWVGTLFLSLVIPCYNEAGNLDALLAAIGATMNTLGLPYEVILTDDCSTDGSWDLLKRHAERDRRIRIQRLSLNCGESAASFAGMKAARGTHIVTLDADLQNDPRDLPRFLEALKHYDCVCGTRVESRGQGDNWVRILSSRLANAVRNLLSGEQISDAGCTYRAFKRECVSNLKFFKGMHRFLPTLIKMEGYTVVEIPVANNPRFAGQSHYGVWNRLFSSFADLLAVRWMKKRMFRFQVQETVN